MTGLLSPAHIVVLLVVLLLVFGAKRLPELGRSLGTGMREFKHSIGADPAEQPASLLGAPAPEAVAPPAIVAQPAAVTEAQAAVAEPDAVSLRSQEAPAAKRAAA